MPIGPRIDGGRELAEEEADRDRERRRDQHGAERRDERPDDELARAVELGIVDVGIPGASSQTNESPYC